jgi:hypothetical protein
MKETVGAIGGLNHIVPVALANSVAPTTPGFPRRRVFTNRIGFHPATDHAGTHGNKQLEPMVTVAQRAGRCSAAFVELWRAR